MRGAKVAAVRRYMEKRLAMGLDPRLAPQLRRRLKAVLRDVPAADVDDVLETAGARIADEIARARARAYIGTQMRGMIARRRTRRHVAAAATALAVGVALVWAVVTYAVGA